MAQDVSPVVVDEDELEHELAALALDEAPAVPVTPLPIESIIASPDKHEQARARMNASNDDIDAALEALEKRGRLLAE